MIFSIYFSTKTNTLKYSIGVQNTPCNNLCHQYLSGWRHATVMKRIIQPMSGRDATSEWFYVCQLPVPLFVYASIQIQLQLYSLELSINSQRAIKRPTLRLAANQPCGMSLYSLCIKHNFVVITVPSDDRLRFTRAETGRSNFLHILFSFHSPTHST